MNKIIILILMLVITALIIVLIVLANPFAKSMIHHMVNASNKSVESL